MKGLKVHIIQRQRNEQTCTLIVDYFTLKFPINLLSQLQNSSHTAPPDKPNTTPYRTYILYKSSGEIRVSNNCKNKFLSLFKRLMKCCGQLAKSIFFQLIKFFLFCFYSTFLPLLLCTISFLINCCTCVNQQLTDPAHFRKTYCCLFNKMKTNQLVSTLVKNIHIRIFHFL